LGKNPLEEVLGRIGFSGLTIFPRHPFRDISEKINTPLEIPQKRYLFRDIDIPGYPPLEVHQVISL